MKKAKPKPRPRPKYQKPAARQHFTFHIPRNARLVMPNTFARPD